MSEKKQKYLKKGTVFKPVLLWNELCITFLSDRYAIESWLCYEIQFSVSWPSYKILCLIKKLMKWHIHLSYILITFGAANIWRTFFSWGTGTQKSSKKCTMKMCKSVNLLCHSKCHTMFNLAVTREFMIL